MYGGVVWRPPTAVAMTLYIYIYLSQKQLQDYTAWVNNYLRRRPGAPLVSDLRWSLGNGITFVHLVEIVGEFSGDSGDTLRLVLFVLL